MKQRKEEGRKEGEGRSPRGMNEGWEEERNERSRKEESKEASNKGGEEATIYQLTN